MADWFDRTIDFLPKASFSGGAPSKTFATYGSMRHFGQSHVVNPDRQTGPRGEPEKRSTGPHNRDILVDQLYPVEWFRGMQTYVKALYHNQPTAIDECVYWALMLMGSIGNGLWALNANDITWSTLRYGVESRTLDMISLQRPLFTPAADRQPPGIVNEFTAPQLMEMRKLAGSTGFALPGMWGPHRTNAPFLRLPLVSFDHLRETATYGNARYANTLRADWWERWIAEPTSKHVPWGSDGGHLYTLTPAIIGRMYGEGERQGWAASRLFVDNTAKEWLEKERSLVFTGAGGEARREVYRRMWNFFAFTGRYYNPCVRYNRANGCPECGKHSDRWKISTDRGQADGFFGTLPQIVSVSRQPNSPFMKAWNDGEYVKWAKWFSDLDMAPAVENLVASYQGYCAQGFIQEHHPVVNKSKVSLWAVNLVPKEAYDEVKDMEFWSTLTEWMGPVSVAIQFVASVWTVNAYGIISSAIRTMELIQDAQAKKDIPVWDTMRPAPQGFLRSCGNDKGLWGWCGWDVGNQKMEKVFQRFGASLTDVTAAIQKEQARLGAGISDVVLKAQTQGLSIGMSVALRRFSSDLKTKPSQPTLSVSQQAAAKFALAPPPSMGGPVVNTTKPKPTLRTEMVQSWMKTGVWASVAGVGSYLAWRFSEKKGLF